MILEVHVPMKKAQKVVLAYSGGLDTSVILKWLVEEYGAEVIAFAADLGQAEELDGLEAKALKTGAAKIYIEDLREDFVRDFVFPALRANAVYENDYLLGTSLARPLIALKQVQIALAEGADGVAHGATGKGNDQVRFELTQMALAPQLKTVAPWRLWDFRSRTDLIEYAKKHGIPVPATVEKPYSCDRNLLHMSYEGGQLEDPWVEPDTEMFTLCTPLDRTPDQPQYVEVDFEQGVPVAVDGQRLSPAALLSRLNDLGGRHGVGRVDLVENRFVGMKSRGVYETPGGTILHRAHRALESITLDREAMHLKDSLVVKYAQMVYNGFWYSAERLALQALVDQTQTVVNGTARLKLFKGNCLVAGRKSPNSLYNMDLATFERDEVYNQKDAAGFIRLAGLRLRGQHRLPE
jgi:argininosuccinate synthase